MERALRCRFVDGGEGKKVAGTVFGPQRLGVKLPVEPRMSNKSPLKNLAASLQKMAAPPARLQ
jgi:hypothetical protein